MEANLIATKTLLQACLIIENIVPNLQTIDVSMSEYEKYTVVKLRDELVRRGLPKTGLKAALVQRLQEADAHSGVAEPSSVAQPLTDGANSPQPETFVLARSSEDEAGHAGFQGKEADANHDAPQNQRIPEQMHEPAVPPREDNGDDIVDSKINEVVGNGLKDVVNHNGIAPEQPLANRIDNEEGATRATLSESTLQSLPDVEDQHPTLGIAQTQESMVSMAAPEEIAEDSKKRKRRSQSPPPSSIDMQKRLKTGALEPKIELVEDYEEPRDKSNSISSIPQSDIPDDTPSHMEQVNGHADSIQEGQSSPGERSDSGKDTEPTAPRYNGLVGKDESSSPKRDGTSIATQIERALSPAKLSPIDNRFKNLLPGPLRSDSTIQQTAPSEIEDRAHSPAVHPATSALYIRELMRPLKPESIRDHLAALATPPDAPVDTAFITEFFLDSIRTHCLVGLNSVSAASRVRSGLHDRIWPNERDRRPLFVDFIPEEKLREWIDVEQNAPSGRGHAQKRWEVIYEVENGETKAYLQEVGSHIASRSTDKASNVNAGQGVKGAPSGPRVRDTESAKQSQPETGQGFRALDDLFNSTMAKPKLYYQSVSENKAVERRKRLADGRGGGRNDEMRRYTFEDDLLVDKAPEFGNRRGGHGGRGGHSGSYRGRGRGFPSDDYRGGGDSWRQQPPRH